MENNFKKNTFWKTDDNTLDYFKFEPVEKNETREDFKNTFKDNIFYYISVFWIIFFIYFIISFFLPKSINIEEARLDLYNQTQISLEKDLKKAKVILYKLKANRECLEANSLTWKLVDCNLLNKD